MLEELLRRVAEGGVHSYADLAKTLDISEALLEQMLGDLAHMGYLRRVSEDCSGHCAHCPMAGICAVGGSGKVWALTEKGNALVKRQAPTSD